MPRRTGGFAVAHLELGMGHLQAVAAHPDGAEDPDPPARPHGPLEGLPGAEEAQGEEAAAVLHPHHEHAPPSHYLGGADGTPAAGLHLGTQAADGMDPGPVLVAVGQVEQQIRLGAHAQAL